ncbi:MAG: DUF1565 domain-containing protein [Candidatus Delongbacteria bacterium]|jgi:hypothetical protein|nr:DUF1565 domain-containing protein [Candidatus Delongbacteria bacterium]
MKKIYLVSLFLLVSNLIFATIINTPTVSGTWDIDSSPYNIYNDIEIPNGETLAINPGVEVVFYGHFRFDVQGSILAVGTDVANITFRANDTEEGWLGIRFDQTPIDNAHSEISFCTITNGNANILNIATGTALGGAIFVREFNKVSITNNTFTDNKAFSGSAICCWSSSPEIKNNVFRNNRAGNETTSGYATIECRWGSCPKIWNNLIEKNSAVGLNYAAGAAIKLRDSSNAFIKNNIIRENYIISDGNLAEGTAMYIHTSDPLIINNLIYDNYIEPAASHGSGGAIFFYNSNAKLINNTIKTNIAREGGALWFKLSSPDFHNNIIRANEAATIEEQIFFDDEESDPNFYHNNIEGGKESFGFKYPSFSFTGAWVNNIDEDPIYEDHGNGITFDLATNSPCVDAGSLDYLSDITIEELDLLGNERIVGDNIDIGAVELYARTPENISMSRAGSIMTISWDINPLSTSYKIYSSDNPNGEFVLIDVVTSNSYEFTTEQDNKKFYYVVSSIE